MSQPWAGRRGSCSSTVQRVREVKRIRVARRARLHERPRPGWRRNGWSHSSSTRRGGSLALSIDAGSGRVLARRDGERRRDRPAEPRVGLRAARRARVGHRGGARRDRRRRVGGALGDARRDPSGVDAEGIRERELTMLRAAGGPGDAPASTELARPRPAARASVVRGRWRAGRGGRLGATLPITAPRVADLDPSGRVERPAGLARSSLRRADCGARTWLRSTRVLAGARAMRRTRASTARRRAEFVGGALRPVLTSCVRHADVRPDGRGHRGGGSSAFRTAVDSSWPASSGTRSWRA